MEESNVIKFGRKSGSYPCFSNFYTCPIVIDGIKYSSSEAAWQAQKTLDKEDRKRFANLKPGASKKEGRRVTLRSDWEDIKYNLMVDVLYQKFTQNLELGIILLSTAPSILIENTTGWHDNEWGNCECPRCINKEGKNKLGKALMEVRDRLAQLIESVDYDPKELMNPENENSVKAVGMLLEKVNNK